MQAQYKSDFGLMFAGLVIAMLPTLLVYIFLQEKLTGASPPARSRGDFGRPDTEPA